MMHKTNLRLVFHVYNHRYDDSHHPPYIDVFRTRIFQVGVGALAGSTIMLLTIPWCLSVYGGRVDLDSDGKANYRKTPKLSPQNA